MGRSLLVVAFAFASALALVLAGCDGEEKQTKGFSEAKREIAKLSCQQLASEAFPMWSVRNPDKACPDSIDALLEYTSMKGAKDPWGTPMQMLCGDAAPAAARGGMGVRSAGPDARFDTADDVHSWE